MILDGTIARGRLLEKATRALLTWMGSVLHIIRVWKAVWSFVAVMIAWFWSFVFNRINRISLWSQGWLWPIWIFHFLFCENRGFSLSAILLSSFIWRPRNKQYLKSINPALTRHCIQQCLDLKVLASPNMINKYILLMRAKPQVLFDSTESRLRSLSVKDIIIMSYFLYHLSPKVLWIKWLHT